MSPHSFLLHLPVSCVWRSSGFLWAAVQLGKGECPFSTRERRRGGTPGMQCVGVRRHLARLNKRKGNMSAALHSRAEAPTKWKTHVWWPCLLLHALPMTRRIKCRFYSCLALQKNISPVAQLVSMGCIPICARTRHHLGSKNSTGNRHKSTKAACRELAFSRTLRLSIFKKHLYSTWPF